MFLVYVRPQTLLAEIEDALAEACGHAVSCGFSTFACTDCTDDVENRSDKSWLCNNRSSRAMNACTRTTHRLTGKVSKNTEKFRLAFNQISLSEPNVLLLATGSGTVICRQLLENRDCIPRYTEEHVH